MMYKGKITSPRDLLLALLVFHIIELSFYTKTFLSLLSNFSVDGISVSVTIGIFSYTCESLRIEHEKHMNILRFYFQ